MADEIKRDTVDYRDPTPFDGSKLQPIGEISKAIRHKTYGVDTREAIAQQGEALVKLMQEAGGNQSAEVAAARGNFELLGIREDAQDNAIAVTNSRLANKADKTYIDDYLSQLSYVPETVASVGELKSKYPNGKPGLFITADNGHKYIWTNGAWKDAGIYQSVGIEDESVDYYKVSKNILNLTIDIPKGNPADYNPDSGIFTFPNTGDVQTRLSWGNEFEGSYYLLPKEGLTIKNTKDLHSAVKLIFDYRNKDFIFKEWWETVEPYQTTIFNYRQGSFATSIFPVTINGRSQYVPKLDHVVIMGPSSEAFIKIDKHNRTVTFPAGDTDYVFHAYGQVVIGAPKEGKVIEIPRWSETQSTGAYLLISLNTGEFSWSTYTNLPKTQDSSQAIVMIIRRFDGDEDDFKQLNVSWSPMPWVMDDKLFGKIPLARNVALQTSVEDAVKNVMHRGYNDNTPENVAYAFKQAKARGYSMVETDVTFNKDNEPMIIHDDTINRTARNADGTELSEVLKVGDLTTAQLKNYDYGLAWGKQYKGEQILTLDEFLKLVKPLNLYPYIELKGVITDDQARIVTACIDRNGLDDGRYAFISFGIDNLNKLNALKPNADYGYIYSREVNEQTISNLSGLKSSNNRVFLDYGEWLIQDSTIPNQIKEAGFTTECWTVSDTERVKKLVDYGVTGITTSYVNVMDELVK
ncbi:glycerophosphodiester phosphodiesterase [Latilactobacillus fragifolii]|uniref:glycerophosphodiester phosphodiesterase n=1 Tax=Latilactobacillus fragifolii TaxID=2814244 RepID=UPI001ABA13E2|nr:glycerophosphodiester phosphodiesterase family protein [Latilactobacillus fragifolii]